MIRIFNSLTKKKEPFAPLKEGEVRVYVCGVTVYDESHIGHARSAFVFDMVRRTFRARGFKTRFVRNVTDVDDKIIDRAREELSIAGQPLTAQALRAKTSEVSERYLSLFYRDMDALGIGGADLEPRATGHIPEMIRMIQTLFEKGLAYQAGGDVFFEVKKFKPYGKLSKQSPDQMMSGARVDIDDRKRDPLDFALWKQAKEGEPSWDSPWGPGRPGWHVECSTMSTHYLGAHFDIHAGGRDLIFPHHENEIAQSEGATGMPFANVWMHNGLLTINGEKMAKSLGNFVSISEALKQHPAEVLNLFFLLAHYASPVDYTKEKMDQAARARERFYVFFDRLAKLRALAEPDKPRRPSSRLLEWLDSVDEAKWRFDAAMDDDFNTPAALSVLFDLVALGNKILEEHPSLSEQELLALRYIGRVLQELGDTIGLFRRAAAPAAGEPRRDPLIEWVVTLRDSARHEKNFALSDKIRDDLARLGILLEDTSQGTSYRLVK